MRRATWILWLMLALLPFRGWAVAGMGLPQVASPMATAASADATRLVAMPACHQASPDEGGSGATCQACDWCHAALGLAPRVILAAVPPPAERPVMYSAQDTGRAAIDGLERPPRSFLA